MGMSISPTCWKNLDEEILSAVIEHAQKKSKDQIDWNQWLKLKRLSGGFDCSYETGTAIPYFLEEIMGKTMNMGFYTIFVPYIFNTDLCTELTNGIYYPSSFFYDKIFSKNLQETIVLIEGYYFIERYNYSFTDEYYKQVEQDAKLFESMTYEEEKNADWKLHSHFAEFNLMKCLNIAIPQKYPVVIYP